MIYDLIEFLKIRVVKCFMTSSSIRVLTYAFCCTSIENQFAFFFNLLRIADNQSSMMRFLSSVKNDESSNFLNVAIKTTTSSSIVDKNVFEFAETFSERFLSLNSIFNSRMMSIASCNLFV